LNLCTELKLEHKKISSLNFNPQFATVKEKMSRFANGGVLQQVFEFLNKWGVFSTSFATDSWCHCNFKIKIKRWVVRGCN
jgi:hypothetical protein